MKCARKIWKTKLTVQYTGKSYMPTACSTSRELKMEIHNIKIYRHYWTMRLKVGGLKSSELKCIYLSYFFPFYYFLYLFICLFSCFLFSYLLFFKSKNFWFFSKKNFINKWFVRSDFDGFYQLLTLLILKF